MNYNSNSNSIWLPEPSVLDDTYVLRGEHILDWLSRSTIMRAKECRRFLNEHLSKLPVNNQSKIFHDLRYKWHSTFFELIVARLLQELGGTLVFENNNRDGKCPDFKARFTDATIIVEAKAPIFNKTTKEELKNQEPLLVFIESKIPKGWGVSVRQLPDIGPADSQKEFKRTVESMLRIPPPSEDDEDIELTEELATGIIHLHLWPKKITSKQLMSDPPFATFDNSEQCIRNAVKKKRIQVRNSEEPVLLAIRASGLASGFDDFDMALFGRGYDRYDEHHRLVETGFATDGLFNERRDKTPTYAGVLAFLTVGFNACTEPVLYHHPRFSGILPETFLQFEQRMYNEKSNEIQIQPSKAQSVIERLNFVNNGK